MKSNAASSEIAGPGISAGVTKLQVIRRTLRHRCPNCGEGALFATGSLRVNRRCVRCQTGFDRGEGFFLGPLVINYTIAVSFFAVPAIVAGVKGAVSWNMALGLALVGCTVPPLLLYRATWAWWLALYFCVVPERLPANGGPIGEGEED
jgi:uncharacterized protein (DUF983 family)